MIAHPHDSARRKHGRSCVCRACLDWDEDAVQYIQSRMIEIMQEDASRLLRNTLHDLPFGMHVGVRP